MRDAITGSDIWLAGFMGSHPVNKAAKGQECLSNAAAAAAKMQASSLPVRNIHIGRN